MKNFDHPNILKLLGICTTKPVHIVLEYCCYGDLRNHLLAKGATIAIATKLLWCSQLASALAYLETLNFVHRDIAARNILLYSESKIKLSDFGLTRETTENLYTSEKRSKLPIKWMAPESIERLVFSTKSDVWSFGVTAWEIFNNGNKPYSNVINGEVFQMLERGNRLSMPAQCPPSLYNLLTKCWSFEPGNRPKCSEIKMIISEIIEQRKSPLKNSKRTVVNDEIIEKIQDLAVREENLDVSLKSEVENSEESYDNNCKSENTEGSTSPASEAPLPTTSVVTIDSKNSLMIQQVENSKPEFEKYSTKLVKAVYELKSKISSHNDFDSLVKTVVEITESVKLIVSCLPDFLELLKSSLVKQTQEVGVQMQNLEKFEKNKEGVEYQKILMSSCLVVVLTVKSIKEKLEAVCK